jgi:Nucleotidyl transferase AbiEii toxin, Type IV TA system
MFSLYEEFRKLVEALDEHHVDYALCGGMAMAVYDRPRATVDIDLLILSKSLDQVIAIATALDYTIRGMDMTFANGAIEIRRVSKIHSQTGHVLSLDLLLVTPETREVWDSRVQADWEGGKLTVVSQEGLISLKTMRGSPQDHADISALKEDVDSATN